jgi:hypothetical protein
MRLVAFRFFFIYFLLTISPWSWFYQIPVVPFLNARYRSIDFWVVDMINRNLLHVKEPLNTFGGGSGDTSYAWAQFYTYLLLSVVACLVWTMLDRKRVKYVTLNFILKNMVRYDIAMIAFNYGIIKLFAQQMSYPNLHQMATPLGDLLPMRFSWLFLGYSTSYQVFSGIMELIVGLLLLNRKTVTLGALMGTAVFTHVFLLNLSYDIPVKLYSMQTVICCLFLATYDWKRVWNVFFRNASNEPATYMDWSLTKKWQRIGRYVFKATFILLVVILPFKEAWSRHKNTSAKTDLISIPSGVYAITSFIKNQDTIPIMMQDEMQWKDFIFEKNGTGSILTQDSLFRLQYRRGYFGYKVDMLGQAIAFQKYRDNTNLFKMHYKFLDDRTISLWGKVRNDSLYFELVRTDRHFQLSENQFHWISESNR